MKRYTYLSIARQDSCPSGSRRIRDCNRRAIQKMIFALLCDYHSKNTGTHKRTAQTDVKYVFEQGKSE
jgi:hypothetical protein